ncbi:MAG: aminopeptidase N [Pseudohongiellaceae bacterium]
MKNAQARTTFLKDYTKPSYLIDNTALHFDLFEDHAIVNSTLDMRVNNEAGFNPEADLLLNGSDLTLESISIDGVELEKSLFTRDEDSLTILNVQKLIADQEGGRFTLSCRTKIEPQNNTALEGLYKSKKMFCTQCEAEGFRRITYYLDRPDVMSKFVTTVEADKKKYPVLLSNGNNIASGDSEKSSSRHWVTWEDPFRKPSYLFALVAGDLISLGDTFVTMSGRSIELKIYVEEKDLDKCGHAMMSLKNSMRWDEQEYGREYDLDIFMIVAVDDFNMGAMENKGLNIFNTSCVLANPKTQSDFAFQRVEAVVAHEYFHNWSGNRVTCRDWFQLSLKEGFTVFRDSEFSADMGSRTVKRIEDVAFLRTVQFAEDGGPMAHSVRPDSYMEISNFYTVTIYEKGAEVVRMIQLLVGPENFRKGSDLYFERHDGQAVTTEDFVKAMEDASGVDLTQFRRWYSQAGTPRLSISSSFDESAGHWKMKVSQTCPDTPSQTNKDPFHIPLRLGLLNSTGEPLPLSLVGEEGENVYDRVLDIKGAEQEFVFQGIESKPIPSLLRGFSAPVKLSYDYSHDELFFLMVHDSDGFNRWNASQMLATAYIEQLLSQYKNDQQFEFPELLATAFSVVLDSALHDEDLDKAMVAQLLSPPVLGALIEQSEVADVFGMYKVREFLLDSLAKQLQEKFEQVYATVLDSSAYSPDADSIAKRSLKSLCLSFLVRTGDERWIDNCYDQFVTATDMTNQSAALRILVNSHSEKARPLASEALASFYKQWSHEPLVVDQWLVIQATAQVPTALEHVKALLKDDAFEIRNPNKVRSLIGAFCSQNHTGFHHASGEGYEFLADQVLVLDKLNPQIASRLLTPLTRWKKYDSKRQALMQAQLLRVKAEEGLSKDVFEIVEKSTVL